MLWSAGAVMEVVAASVVEPVPLLMMDKSPFKIVMLPKLTVPTVGEMTMFPVTLVQDVMAESSVALAML
jgi:hypothetical protein